MGRQVIMYKYFNIIYLIISMFLIPGLTGCEGKTKPIEKPEVVSNKIIGVADKNTDQKTVTLQAEKTSASTDPEINRQDAASQSENTNSDELNDKITDESAKQSMNFPGSNNLENSTDPNHSVDEGKRKAAEVLATLRQEASSSLEMGENLLDSLNNPFLNLYPPPGPVPPTPPRPEPPKHEPRSEPTPLEKVDLSQLKLVATLRASSGNKALVEDSTGKGYVINKGTYIGINKGSVIEITNESVIVEEQLVTITGDVKIQKREIKLQKAPGE